MLSQEAFTTFSGVRKNGLIKNIMFFPFHRAINALFLNNYPSRLSYHSTSGDVRCYILCSLTCTMIYREPVLSDMANRLHFGAAWAVAQWDSPMSRLWWLGREGCRLQPFSLTMYARCSLNIIVLYNTVSDCCIIMLQSSHGLNSTDSFIAIVWLKILCKVIYTLPAFCIIFYIPLPYCNGMVMMV